MVLQWAEQYGFYCRNGKIPKETTLIFTMINQYLPFPPSFCFPLRIRIFFDGHLEKENSRFHVEIVFFFSRRQQMMSLLQQKSIRTFESSPWTNISPRSLFVMSKGKTFDRIGLSLLGVGQIQPRILNELNIT